MDMDSSSSSDEEITSSECESDDSSSYGQPEAFEVAQICGQRFQLPQGLCENKNIFKEFFSVRTWNGLSESNRQHLKKFLPAFPENDNAEKNATLQRMFTGENVGFSNPLDEFHRNLKAGNYRPEIARIRSLMRRIHRRESKCQQRRYMSNLVKDMVVSRQWLINTASSLSPGAMESTRLAPPAPSQNAESVLHDPILRTKRRYFQELAAIRTEVGEIDGWSEDENYPEGNDVPLSVSRSKQRRLNVATSGPSVAPLSPGAEDPIVSTLVSKPGERVWQPHEIQITDDNYRALLQNHKQKRNSKVNNMESHSWSSHLKDIASRTLLSTSNKKTLLNLQKSISQTTSETKSSTTKRSIKKEVTPKSVQRMPTPSLQDPKLNQSNYGSVGPPPPVTTPSVGANSSESELDMSETESIIDPVMSPLPIIPKSVSFAIKTSTPVQKQTNPNIASVTSSPEKHSPLLDDPILNTVVKSEPLGTPTFNMITSISQYGGKIQPATLSDLEGIDMLNLPVDLDESNIGILDEITRKTPELMQDTHTSFLSLIRDIMCSTPDHRMSYSTLETRMKSWQENPISPLNDWYNLIDNWLGVLSCAVSFLHGDFHEQPDDFVPYLELKPVIQEYQWIGAGRDSDNLLTPLFQYWIEHREEMSTEKNNQQEVEVEHNDTPKSPPPPRWPTNWTVRKAEQEEVEIFREQERQRYENPHKAFTYRMNGYESVVGPVKGIYNQTAGVTKPRGHSMLNSDRPNFVTILTLVRDATARLPNGEGTRAEICELLKSSQYISQGASDTVLQSVVSGALDRMHTEYDPCVKYDTKRKIWIYLHRNRTESEFEKIHQQHQGMSKHQKKNYSRKSKTKPKGEKTPSSGKHSTSGIESSTTTTTVTTVETPATKQRFKVPVSRTPAMGTGVMATANTVSHSNVVTSTTTSTPPLEPLKPTPAGTSLLLNPNVNKQSLINKNVLEKVQSSERLTNANIKVLTQLPMQQTLTSQIDKTLGKNTAVTTTVQTLQSIIAPRVNSPIHKPGQQVNAKSATKSIVKIVSAPQQGKSLINVSGSIITNHQPPQLFLKQQQVVTSTSGQQQTIIPSISIKSNNQTDANIVGQISQQTTPSQKQQTTLIASHPNQQILQTIVQQPRQTLAGRQIIQAITSQQQLVDQKSQPTILTQTSMPQQIIQMAPGQKLSQTATLIQTKAGGKTTVLTPGQHHLLQNIKQQQSKNTSGIQQTNILSNQALLKQQVALQQFQKQLQQQTVSMAAAKSGTSLLEQSPLRIQTNKSTPGITTQAPLVAKVLTNAAGQVISVESLLAHQKQHGTLPQGTTLRVAGGKLGQTNLIQLSGAVPNQMTQFAVVSQGNLVSMAGGQPRLIGTVAQSPQSISTTANTAQILVAAPSKGVNMKNARQVTQTSNVKYSTTNKVTHQLINAKFITAQSLTGAPKLTTTQQSQAKHIVNQTSKVLNTSSLAKQVVTVSKTGGTVTVNSNQTTAIRMMNPATGLNFTHLAGKPILLASKGNTIQNLQGQNIILRQGVAGQGSTGSGLVISNQARGIGQQTTATLSASHANSQIVLGAPLKIQNINDTILDNQTKGGAHGDANAAQTVLLSTSSQAQDGATGVAAQRVVLASPGHGGQLLAQQILLPQGFQGGTINIKTLQGLKVIPLAQQGKGLTAGRQQLFTRIVNPVSVADTTPTPANVNKSTPNSDR